MCVCECMCVGTREDLLFHVDGDALPPVSVLIVFFEGSRRAVHFDADAVIPCSVDALCIKS